MKKANSLGVLGALLCMSAWIGTTIGDLTGPADATTQVADVENVNEDATEEVAEDVVADVAEEESNETEEVALVPEGQDVPALAQAPVEVAQAVPAPIEVAQAPVETEVVTETVVTDSFPVLSEVVGGGGAGGGGGGLGGGLSGLLPAAGLAVGLVALTDDDDATVIFATPAQ